MENCNQISFQIYNFEPSSKSKTKTNFHWIDSAVLINFEILWAVIIQFYTKS